MVLLALGLVIKGPSYDKLGVNLLADLKRECQIVVDSYRSAWKETGYASNVVKNASSLFHLFLEVIEWTDNIIHVVIDNTADYVAAGRLINQKFKNIHWSPCAAHCLNLILKDISSMPHISNLATCASKITVFVYNHMVFLSWLRQRTTWKQIVRPGATCFATVFITLKSIFERKADLQALVIDTHFTGHKLGRSANGRVVSAIILDNKFWDDCFIVCKLVRLLIKLMRLVDTDDKPSLGYVYEGMLKLKNGIKEMFKHSKTAYQPYTEIINSRWDKHLKKSLHAAAYFLNPACFFDENYKEAPDVMRGQKDNKESKRCNIYDPIDIESIDLVDFWVTEEVVEKELDLSNEIDADLDQGGGGGSSTFYTASLDFSAPSSGNEGDDINEANLQQVMANFDD
ncbi:uncharacterized protein LOC107636114 [Arachis ipaensis]|uniref:uncharacterized protein LOC107636114 n=1 Tax=Arachis ipaensis TaxID=130454 RepID=UPI0007AF0EA6|nr:uncharacterized protein LOC107636114 [Arachis ipaensis]XP_025647306.1 uncharacterized protein LOC112742283 [Arachis hypogaea]